MANIEAVILDMDGLMIDSEPVWIESARNSFKTMNIEFPEGIEVECVGQTQEFVKRRLKEICSPKFNYKEYNQILQKEFKHYVETKGIETKTGIFELLKMLEERGIKKNIATSSTRVTAEMLLAKAGLSKYFDIDKIITRNDVIDPKPYGEPCKKAAAQIGVVPIRCIYLDDSNIGIRSGVAAGMRVIMVPDVGGPPDERMKLILLKECKNLLEVIEVIEPMLRTNKENVNLKEAR